MLRLGLLLLLERVPDAQSTLAPGKNLLVLRALDDVIAYLNEHFGTISPAAYSWGGVHGTQFDPLWPGGESVGLVPTDGGVGTVNVVETNLFSATGTHAQLQANAGAIFRSVTEFDASGTPLAYVNFAPGNSGEPGDPHFRDLLDDWVENRSRKLPFERADIEARTTEQLVIRRR